MEALTFLLYISLALSPSTILVNGLSSGAPLKACGSLLPGHWWNVTTPIQPRRDEPPYSLVVSTDMVGQGETMQVTIYGDTFQGLFLQARVKDTPDPFGSFTEIPSILQTRDCNDTSDSVTHKDPRDKTNGTVFTWTAPTAEFGDFYFIATLARTHDEFWTEVKSDTVEYTDGATTKPSTEPTDKATVAATTAGADTFGSNQLTMMVLLLVAVVLFRR